jgi:hypothetical protein
MARRKGGQFKVDVTVTVGPVEKKLVGRYTVYTVGEQFVGGLLVYQGGAGLEIRPDETLRAEFERRYGMDEAHKLPPLLGPYPSDEPGVSR